MAIQSNVMISNIDLLTSALTGQTGTSQPSPEAAPFRKSSCLDSHWLLWFLASEPWQWVWSCPVATRAAAHLNCRAQARADPQRHCSDSGARFASSSLPPQWPHFCKAQPVYLGHDAFCGYEMEYLLYYRLHLLLLSH